MTYGTPLDDNGCVKQGAEGGPSIRFERTGLPSVELKTPAPPLGGSLRRLAKGALATWIAPLGCNRPRRVLYAVVLDADGAPWAPDGRRRRAELRGGRRGRRRRSLGPQRGPGDMDAPQLRGPVTRRIDPVCKGVASG